MYKLINKQTHYELSYHDGNAYTMIAKLKNSDALTEYVDKFKVRIQPNEMIEAIKYMVQDNHNVAEFGYNGSFTVSYRE